MKRYALISGPAKAVEAYLPSNYEIVGEVPGTYARGALEPVEMGVTTVIEGRDQAGWTLDGYVLPRLGSGLYLGDEVGLDHPVFKLLPEAS